jgi:hypothetical protein
VSSGLVVVAHGLRHFVPEIECVEDDGIGIACHLPGSPPRSLYGVRELCGHNIVVRSPGFVVVYSRNSTKCWLASHAPMSHLLEKCHFGHLGERLLGAGDVGRWSMTTTSTAMATSNSVRMTATASAASFDQRP